MPRLGGKSEPLLGFSGATVGRAIREGRAADAGVKAWWIGFSAQAREGAQGPLTTQAARRVRQRREA